MIPDSLEVTGLSAAYRFLNDGTPTGRLVRGVLVWVADYLTESGFAADEAA